MPGVMHGVHSTFPPVCFSAKKKCSRGRKKNDDDARTHEFSTRTSFHACRRALTRASDGGSFSRSAVSRECETSRETSRAPRGIAPRSLTGALRSAARHPAMRRALFSPPRLVETHARTRAHAPRASHRRVRIHAPRVRAASLLHALKFPNAPRES